MRGSKNVDEKGETSCVSPFEGEEKNLRERLRLRTLRSQSSKQGRGNEEILTLSVIPHYIARRAVKHLASETYKTLHGVQLQIAPFFGPGKYSRSNRRGSFLELWRHCRLKLKTHSLLPAQLEAFLSCIDPVIDEHF